MAYGEDVSSQRTDKELKELKSNILELIGEVNLAEKEDNFPAQETMCDICGAEGPSSKTEEEAIELWNKRSSI